MAFTVEDVLARRVRLLFVDAREAQKAAPRVAQIMAQEMGKDEKWIEEQIAKFNKVSDNYIVVKQ
jgi:glycerol-3-phosphate dehydrogenase